MQNLILINQGSFTDNPFLLGKLADYDASADADEDPDISLDRANEILNARDYEMETEDGVGEGDGMSAAGSVTEKHPHNSPFASAATAAASAAAVSSYLPYPQDRKIRSEEFRLGGRPAVPGPHSLRGWVGKYLPALQKRLLCWL